MTGPMTGPTPAPMTGPTPAEPPAAAALSIVAGHPTPAETAAVLVVLTAVASAVASAAAAGTQRAGGGHRSEWSDRSRLLRPAVSAGPGAWRASALPG
jgi:hypothetical protein